MQKVYYSCYSFSNNCHETLLAFCTALQVSLLFNSVLSFLSLLLGDSIEVQYFVIACRAMAGPGNCSRICGGFHAWIINLKWV